MVTLNADNRSLMVIAAHELTHAILGRSIGSSTSGTVLEGTAMYFQAERFPRHKDYGHLYQPGYKELKSRNPQGKETDLGISHTQFMENLEIQTNVPKSEYAYRFGAIFIKQLIDT